MFIVRHGLREDWANPSWKDTATNLQDTPLSYEGIQQAKEVAQFFRTTQHNIRHIFVSPYTRTCHTASIIADELNLPIRLEYGVTEFLGVNEELNPPSINELVRLFPRIDTSYKSKLGIPKSESKALMMERCKQVMYHIAENFATDEAPGDILVVTHAATAIGLVRGLLDDPEFPVKCGVCSASKLVRDGKRWKCLLNGETSHLSKGEQFPWEFPDEVKKRVKS